jgi:hypothetical protein
MQKPVVVCFAQGRKSKIFLFFWVCIAGTKALSAIVMDAP